MKLFKLIENEILKIYFKKRLITVSAILFVLILLFAYGQNYTSERTKQNISRRIGIEYTEDWREFTQQQIIDLERRLQNPYIPDEGRSSLNVRIEQLQYHLDNDINPLDDNAAKFVQSFFEQAISLFFPLLVIILAGDMVSSEVMGGTIKLLLIKPVSRWKVFLSKYIALIITTGVLVFIAVVISVAVSGMFFGYGGWNNPVVSGFRVVNGSLDTTGIQNIPQWSYNSMVIGLTYFVCIIIATIAYMVSVFAKSTSASIGIMMSALIGGSFLSFFLSDWEFTRYLFVVNMRLTDYLSGSFQPIEGITLLFSIIVLAIWGLLSFATGMVVFTKKDMLA